MKLGFSLLCLGVVLVVASCSPVDNSAFSMIHPIQELAPRPVISPKNNETDFFFNMTTDDQMWLMRESMQIHLNSNSKSSVVPDTLKSKMLNGEIPVNFQKAFTKWLTDHHKFNDDDIRSLLNGDEVCGWVACTSLPGLGETCCPFG